MTSRILTAHQEALDFIQEGRGKHFDPEMTDVFIKYGQDFEKIANQYSD